MKKHLYHTSKSRLWEETVVTTQKIETHRKDAEEEGGKLHKLKGNGTARKGE